MRRRVLIAALAAALIAAGLTAVAVAQGNALAGFGIVLLHGKGGTPGGLIDSLAAALRAEGAIVVAPRMPWSGNGGIPDTYSATYEQALDEIGRAVAQLKEKGAKRIVVAGHSLGANGAIGYAARSGSDLAGVIALAAGHTPERMKRPELVAGLASARQLVAGGKGSAPAMLPDLNLGKTFNVKVTPKTYLSYFDPDGPAVIPRNAAAMPAIPFLWVIGRKDPMAAGGPGYAFNKAAKNPKSRYLEVNADHKDTPDAARAEVIAWLKSL
jgi:pimeloyl-ACP methyl ester carboxylesterase